MKTLLTLVVLFTAALAQDSDVLVLTDATFSDALSQHANIFVEFYAPWCGHCKRLAPEYEKVATELKGKIAVAKVDCTTEEGTCQQQGIQGFPTLKLFRNGKPLDYEGERSAAAIVSFALKKTGPPAEPLDSADKLQQFVAGKQAAVVGFFGEKDSVYQAFISVATASEDLPFGEVVGTAASVDSTVEKLPLVKLYTGGKALEFVPSDDSAALSEWITNNAYPLVAEINEKVFKRYVAAGKHIAILFYDTTAPSGTWVTMFNEIAQSLKSKLSFAYADSNKFKQQLPRFGATGNVIPTVVVIHPENQQKWPWDESNALEQPALHAWLESVADGLRPSFMKSEPIPEANDQPVKVIVGKTFDQIVQDPTKDILVEFYAPWCGHCKNLAPVYEQLAQSFASEPTITIAKIDATANDTPAPVKGFPTLYFFPANDKSHPIEYTGDRSLSDMETFVRSHASTLKGNDGTAKDEL
jgi:protein disulfide-isomerase A1